MNLSPNLKFSEIVARYALLIALGIIGGMLHNYWFIYPAMAVFLTAILGWSPEKEWMKNRKENATAGDHNVLQHKTAH